MAVFSCYGQTTLTAIPQNPFENIRPGSNELAPALDQQSDVEDPCSVYRTKFTLLQSQQSQLDRRAVIAVLGAPTEFYSSDHNATIWAYRAEGCLGEIRFDSKGFLRSALLGPQQGVGGSAKLDPAESRKPIVGASKRFPSTPKSNRAMGNRARTILLTTMVLGGVGAAVYFGAKASSGNCSVPSDRASDGSRCGGRSASSRPGGRP